MMNPASLSGGSSSDDDDDSSSSSSSSNNVPGDGGAKIVRAVGRPRWGGMDLEPAGSDDGSSVDDDDDDDDDEEEEEVEEEEEEEEEEEDSSGDEELELGVSNFDDLPTDDSEDEDGDGSDGDSSVGDGEGSDDEGGEDVDRDDDDDVPLGERVASRAGVGRRHRRAAGGGVDEDDDDRRNGGGRGGRAERKERAIELASQRLRESRRRKVAGASNASDPSKTGKRSDRNNSNDRPSLHDDDDDDDEHDDGDRDRQRPPGASEKPKRKKSKHAPTEMSSGRRDYFARGRPDLNSSGIGVTIGANRYRARDPRTVSLSGRLDADAFAGRYGFLDEMQEGEIETLKRRVSAWKTSGKRGQKDRKRLGITTGGGSLEADQEELTRLLQERAERKRADVVRAARRAVKERLKKDVATGKHGAYYPKRSELRKMEAEAKFEEIRKRGGDEAVDKAIAKRRKKNVAKEARSMPSHMIS